MIKNQQNSVTKIYPHVSKKNFYYFSGLIWQNEDRKSFTNSIISVQGVDGVKNIKKILSRWGFFLVTLLLSLLLGENDLN